MRNLLTKKYCFNWRERQKGQVLLIIVLVMLVALTVGLSVVSRSITDVKTASEEENSQRAFAAAEAGIEKALSSGQTIPQGSFGNVTFEAAVVPVEGVSRFKVNNGNPIEQNDGVDVWFVPHNADGTPNYSSPPTVNYFSVIWGSPSSDSCSNSTKPAAIEVIIIQGTLASPTTKRYAYDPCSRGNSFSLAQTASGSYTIDGQDFKFRINPSDISTITNALVARAIPLYAQTTIAISACNDSGSCFVLPSQGKKIEAKGESNGAVRKISVFQPYPKLPNEFYYTLLKPIKPI